MHKNANRIICLTPVKNEAWILDTFLKAASVWADTIIVADQLSTDDSRTICKKFPKVVLINNNTESFDESVRQKLLLDKARGFKGQKTLIALDADEFLTPNFSDPEWQLLKFSPPKTAFNFCIHNLNPNLDQYWSFDKKFPLAIVDDNQSDIFTRKIHNNRLPLGRDWKTIELKNLQILHFQYVDLKRNASKMRWYQCWEKINNPKRHFIDIYRQYNHDKIVFNKTWLKTPAEWLTTYKRLGVELSDFKTDGRFWWDSQVEDWLKEYGDEKFRWLDISGSKKSVGEKLLLSYLKFSQKYYPWYGIDRLDNLLKRLIV